MLPLLTSVYSGDCVPDHVSDSEAEPSELCLTTLPLSNESIPVAVTPSSSSSASGPSAPQVPVSVAPNPPHNDDDTNFRLYMNATVDLHSYASRRGLRKRTFASTHPYLTDQAHYLGLATSESLNEMFLETQDLEGVVRFLNHLYTKKRERNPRDHKYKPKNFYSIIGQQSRDAQAKENSELGLANAGPGAISEPTPATQDPELVLRFSISSADSSDYELSNGVSSLSGDDESSMPPMPFFKRPYPNATSFLVSLDESSSSGSESDTIVRVGGKNLKERRVLHGTLPESAKRLAMYKAKISQPKRRRIRVAPELRKGLAIKRIGAGAQDLASELGYGIGNLNSDDPLVSNIPSLSPQQPTIDTFGVLSSESDIEIQSHVDKTHVSAPHKVPASYWDEYDSLQTLDALNSVPIPGNAYLSDQTTEKMRDHQFVYLNSSSGSESVREQDFVDPMFANRKRERSLGTSAPQKSRAQRPRSLHSRSHRPRSSASRGMTRVRPKSQSRAANVPPSIKPRQSSAFESSGNFAINRQELAFPPSAPRNKVRTNSRNTAANGLLKKQTNLTRFLPQKIPSGSDLSPPLLHDAKPSSFKLAKSLSRVKTPPPSRLALWPPHAKNLPASRLAQSTLPQQTDTLSAAKSIPKTRTILHDQFQFTRQPFQYTTTYEAESVKSHSVPPRLIPTFHRPHPIGDPLLFDAGSIVRSVDIQKINNLDLGRTYHVDQDMVTITLRGETYTLTLIDRQKSSLVLDNIFGALIKMLRNPLFFSLLGHFEETYECLRKILVWLLIAQSPFLEIIRKRLNIIFDLLSHTRDNPTVKVAKVIAPFLILLSFINSKICRRRDLQSHPSTLRFHAYVVEYWLIHFSLCFNPTHSSKPVGSKRESESWYIICSILNFENSFWSLLEEALQRGVNPPDTHSLLQVLYDLSVSNVQAPHDWKCFIGVYGMISSSSQALHHIEFLQIVSILCRRHGWTISDQMVVTLFRTVAGRRFANFDDERKLPRVLRDMNSRYDLPTDTFFEKFMALLYTHISDSVNDMASLKRLVRKLLPSSHYQYESNPKHTAMYINRLNFLLLLQRVTDMDLSSQLTDLTSKIFATSDITLLLATMEGIRAFSTTALQRGTHLPVDALVLSLNFINDHYTSLAGITHIWKDLQNMLPTLIVMLSTPFQKLDIFKVFGAITHNYAEQLEMVLSDMILNLLNSLPQVNHHFEMNASETFATLAKRSYNVIDTNMGRLPLQNAVDETRIDALIEKSLMIWIRCFRMSPLVKWEVLVLQIYPYIGNSYLRAKFVLFFYKEILAFNSLHLCKDIIIRATLRQICSFAPTKYLYDFILMLRQTGYLIFAYDKVMSAESIFAFQMTHDRLRVLTSVLQNIAQADDMAAPTKALFIKEVLRTLSGQYEAHHMRPEFKEFCSNAVLATERICGSFITAKDLMLDCVLKMGISRHDLEMLNWESAPLKDKLARLHKELANSLVFKTDSSEVLKKYTLGDGVDLLYHLCSIYSRAILLDQQNKWRFLLTLISFFHQNVLLCKFNVKALLIDRFLIMAFEYPRYKECTRPVDEYFRLQVCTIVSKMFQSMMVIFDGYKDLESLRSMWKTQASAGTIKLLDASLYSNFSLFDIHQIGSDAQMLPIAEPSEEEIVSLRLSFAKELTLNASLGVQNYQEGQILPYDFSF